MLLFWGLGTEALSLPANAGAEKPRVDNGAALQGVVRPASRSLSFIQCQAAHVAG